MRLRPGVDADLEAVVEVFLGCWRGSYATVLPASLVASMSDDDAHRLWSRALGRADREVVVVELDGRVAGVVSSAVDDADAGLGWVHSLYVAPAGQGRGLGGLLLQEAARSLSAAGAARAALWVFAVNAPSLGFYASQGWTPTGERRVEDQFGQPELRLERTLTVNEVAGVGVSP